MISLVTLPSTAVASTTEYIGYMVTDLWGLLAMAIGFPLAFYVIEYIIEMPTQNEKELLKLRGGVDTLQKNIKELQDFYDVK